MCPIQQQRLRQNLHITGCRTVHSQSNPCLVGNKHRDKLTAAFPCVSYCKKQSKLLVTEEDCLIVCHGSGAHRSLEAKEI